MGLVNDEADRLLEDWQVVAHRSCKFIDDRSVRSVGRTELAFDDAVECVQHSGLGEVRKPCRLFDQFRVGSGRAGFLSGDGLESVDQLFARNSERDARGGRQRVVGNLLFLGGCERLARNEACFEHGLLVRAHDKDVEDRADSWVEREADGERVDIEDAGCGNEGGSIWIASCREIGGATSFGNDE